MTSRWKEILLYVGLALALLIPRLPGLDSFATGDEPYWLSMGANFYYALGQREFQNTIYEYQPAVTTMWEVTAAMVAYFPEYRGLGQGYLEFEKGVLDPFMLEHGKDPLILLRDARFIQVVIVTALLLAAFYLLQKLLDRRLAAFAILLAGFDPFFLGQSCLLDHEALLACFVLVSVLALAVYLFQGRRFLYLLVSAVAAGLAQLTKSSAAAVLAPIGLLLLADLYHRRAAWKQALLDAFKTFTLWFLALALTYFLFWPGMWVAPAKMLGNVYGNAFSYAFQGARVIAVEDTEPAAAGLDTDLGSFLDLTGDLFARLTPLTWLGLLLALPLLFQRTRELVPPWAGPLAALSGFTALVFVVMFALAKGRNSPHYMLTSYVMLNLLAGLGWYVALRWLSTRTSLAWVPVTALTLVLMLQAGSGLMKYPYYFTYQNPLVPRGDKPAFPYGEGLELAARYLASQPDAKDATALVYYSRGCFSYFYPGPVERFKPYFVDAGHEADLQNALDGADYLVVYYAIQGHLDKYQPLLTSLADQQPVKEIWLDGYKYAVIYKLK
ncbi:MAG: glycosyltransferase family 39 protein [Chloroflexi bacterium]|nr:glycosyltransferase family 39 protein [Chloroflexota bacterium]